MCHAEPVLDQPSLIRNVVYPPWCAKTEIVWNGGSMRTAPVK
jgi:hypothetical protein